MCAFENKFNMDRLKNACHICIMSILVLNVIRPQIVFGVSESLFASLSQLELLWQNDIDIVQTMEHLLEDQLPEYEPLKRYQ